MKKFLSIASLALVASFALFSCGGASSEDGVAGVAAVEYNSEYFEDVVFSNDGEFVGLELGDSRESAKSKLPSEAFEDENDSYLYYYWDLGENSYYLDLFFDENNKLNSIDGYVYFYDAEGNYDDAAAADFYNDMKANLVDKYGSEEEVVDGEYKYIAWYLDDKDVKVSLEGGEVYWYFYAYGE